MVKTALLVHMFERTLIQVHIYSKKNVIDGYYTVSIRPQ